MNTMQPYPSQSHDKVLVKPQENILIKENQEIQGPVMTGG